MARDFLERRRAAKAAAVLQSAATAHAMKSHSAAPPKPSVAVPRKNARAPVQGRVSGRAVAAPAARARPSVAAGGTGRVVRRVGLGAGHAVRNTVQVSNAPVSRLLPLDVRVSNEHSGVPAPPDVGVGGGADSTSDKRDDKGGILLVAVGSTAPSCAASGDDAISSSASAAAAIVHRSRPATVVADEVTTALFSHAQLSASVIPAALPTAETSGSASVPAALPDSDQSARAIAAFQKRGGTFRVRYRRVCAPTLSSQMNRVQVGAGGMEFVPTASCDVDFAGAPLSMCDCRHVGV